MTAQLLRCSVCRPSAEAGVGNRMAANFMTRDDVNGLKAYVAGPSTQARGARALQAASFPPSRPPSNTPPPHTYPHTHACTPPQAPCAAAQNRLESTVLVHVSHSNLKVTKFFELRLDMHVSCVVHAW